MINLFLAPPEQAEDRISFLLASVLAEEEDVDMEDLEFIDRLLAVAPSTPLPNPTNLPTGDPQSDLILCTTSEDRIEGDSETIPTLESSTTGSPPMNTVSTDPQ